MATIIRAKAPLRLGLAGGGTDVSPYCDEFGGSILNVTIDRYAWATIVPRNDNKILIHAEDRQETLEAEALDCLPVNGELGLLAAVYNRIVADFVHTPLSFTLITSVDAPPGSGLGSSSTLVVAVLSAFVQWLKLPLGEYDIAHLAYEIERNDMKMAGGKQDQYASTFGGVNFMEFYENDKVIVNPLRIRPDVLNELNFNLLLYYTGTSRLSAKIIEGQVESVRSGKQRSIEAMHRLKEQAICMKEVLLKGKIDEIGPILDYGWHHKKEMTSGISNEMIDSLYKTAKKAGATGGKISGAGGGGFMIIYCPGVSRYQVIKALIPHGGEFHRFNFDKRGLETWTNP